MNYYIIMYIFGVMINMINFMDMVKNNPIIQLKIYLLSNKGKFYFYIQLFLLCFLSWIIIFINFVYKIYKYAAKALINKHKFSMNNTKVYKDCDCWVMSLHGYIIGKNDEYGLEFNFKGWATRTTVDRIEAFSNYKFNIHHGSLYHNKLYVDSYKWYRVDSFEKDLKDENVS